MRKHTKKRKQSKSRVTAVSESPVSDFDDAEDEKRKAIPVGASLYWEIPGDIPGLGRRRVPLPAEPALPEASDDPATKISPVNIEAAKPSDQMRDLSAHRKINARMPDNVSPVCMVRKNQPEQFDNASLMTSNRLSSAMGLHAGLASVQTSAVPVIPANVPDTDDNSEPETLTNIQTDKSNSSLAKLHMLESSDEKSESNLHTQPAMMSASIKAKTTAVERAEVSKPVISNKKIATVGSQYSATHPQGKHFQSANDHHSLVNETSRKNYIIPALLALLLLLLLGGKGYDYLFETKQPQALVTNQQETPTLLNEPSTAVVVKTEADTGAQVKVIEVSVGKLDQHAISGIQMITHVVVKGDTLWDIAESYLNNPWRYPELAERSKIKNPDLIYPGDLVQIHIKITESASS